MAALWQDWPKLAGSTLAEHCRPLTLRHGVLSVGASHPQWRQALLYSKLQLLAAIRAEGHPVRDLRIVQHHSSRRPALADPLMNGIAIRAERMCMEWRPAPAVDHRLRQAKWRTGGIAVSAEALTWARRWPTAVINSALALDPAR